jgi:hypothetical protein
VKDLLARILCSVADSMWENDKTIGNYAFETGQHELNLAFHYACELRKWLPAPYFDCDFDVAKMAKWYTATHDGNRDHRRPDTIIHRRRHHSANFLVVEVKRLGNDAGAKEDERRIKLLWMSDPYLYDYGASVIMADNEPIYEVRLWSRGETENASIIKNDDERTKFVPADFAQSKLEEIMNSLIASGHTPAAWAPIKVELHREIAAIYKQSLKNGT